MLSDSERPPSRLEKLDEGCFAHLPTAGEDGEFDPDDTWSMLAEAGAVGRVCPEDERYLDTLLPQGWKIVTDDLGEQDTGRSLANAEGIVVAHIVQTTTDPNRFMLLQP